MYYFLIVYMMENAGCICISCISLYFYEIYQKDKNKNNKKV